MTKPAARIWFTTAEVSAARDRLAANRYGGDHDLHDLDHGDITEIIQIVLTATWQRGVAEGRRQATEGWDREWGLALYGHPAHCVLNEHAARGIAAGAPEDAQAKVVSRFVGPWEAAEQAAPTCTCPDIDVTTAIEKPGSVTVKGCDAACLVCPNPYAGQDGDGRGH